MNSLYRTMFFVPGNDPKKIIGAEIYRPDCIIYDLEDSVSIFEKDSARILVKYEFCRRQSSSCYGDFACDKYSGQICVCFHGCICRRIYSCLVHFRACGSGTTASVGIFTWCIFSVWLFIDSLRWCSRSGFVWDRLCAAKDMVENRSSFSCF